MILSLCSGCRRALGRICCDAMTEDERGEKRAGFSEARLKQLDEALWDGEFFHALP